MYICEKDILFLSAEKDLLCLSEKRIVCLSVCHQQYNVPGKFIPNNNFPLVADVKKWTIDNIGNCEVQRKLIVIEIIPTCN